MFQDVYEVKTAAVSDTVNAFFYNIAEAISVGKFKTVKKDMNRFFNPTDEKFSASIMNELPVNVVKACSEYSEAINSYFDFSGREDRKGHYIMSESYLNNIATALEVNNMKDQARNIKAASDVSVIKGDPTGYNDINDYLTSSVSEITKKPVLVWKQVTNGPIERPNVR